MTKRGQADEECPILIERGQVAVNIRAVLNSEQFKKDLKTAKRLIRKGVIQLLDA